MSKPPRILLFTEADVFAGTERHILDLALALRSLNTEVSIASPEPSALAMHCATHNLPHVPIQKKNLIDRDAIDLLRQLLAKDKINLIHAHNGRTALCTAIALRRFPSHRCILTQHFVTPSHATRRGPKAMLYNLVHGWMNRRTHHFIAISSAVADAMLSRREVPKDKITIIPNGIPAPDTSSLTPSEKIRRELSIPPGAPLVVSVARLEKEKELTNLIAAMKTVLQTHPAAHCLIAGQGSLQNDLQAQIDSLGLGRNVHLAGFRPDALSLINAADLFVLPSLAEPFGLVLLEAMSLSKPVIATRSAGPIEIVDDNHTGVLVPPSNPTELAIAITRVLCDPALGAQMGTAGRQRFESHFTSARMAADTLALYQRVLANGRG